MNISELIKNIYLSSLLHKVKIIEIGIDPDLSLFWRFSINDKQYPVQEFIENRQRC